MTSLVDVLKVLNFSSPELSLVITPFVFLLVWQLYVYRKNGAIEFVGFEYLYSRNDVTGGWRRKLRTMLWGVIVIGLGILWAGPRYFSANPLFGPETQVFHKNFIVAFDMSPSMNLPAHFKGYGGEDLRPGDVGSTRYEIASAALFDFLERFRGDRFGLILFSTESFFARWPTVELGNNFLEVLDDSIRRGSGTQLEAFSSLTNTDKALLEARDAFAGKKGAIILISDAEDHIDNMMQAIREVREADIRLYTIGVGMSEETVALLAQAFENDKGFRIFRVDNEDEMEEAYFVIGDVEGSAEFTDEERYTELDLRWIISLVLVFISLLVIWINEIIFHQSLSSKERTKYGI
jgi:hypothetical protein